MQRKVKTVSCI